MRYVFFLASLAAARELRGNREEKKRIVPLYTLNYNMRLNSCILGDCSCYCSAAICFNQTDRCSEPGELHISAFLLVLVE